MSKNLVFHIANKEHLQELSLLVNSAYRGDSSRVGWTTEADLLGGQRTDPQCLQEMLEKDQVILLARSVTQKLVGCVYLKKVSSTESYLGMLTVDPAQQANGLGKEILQAGEDFVRELWRSQKMQMTVITLRQELLAWYERRGYVKTKRIEPFPYGDARFGLPKRSDLQFVVLEKSLTVIENSESTTA